MKGKDPIIVNEKLLEKIKQVVPYVPGEQPQNQTKVIKLNTNENPYPPAPGVAQLLKEMEADKFRLYPDPNCEKLVDTLAEFYGLESNQVFVGVGSDDVIAMSFLTFFNGDQPILFPDISYSFYKVWANLYGIPYKCNPLDENFCLVKEDYYVENGGIIFPNPNAPTAIYVELSFIEDVLQHNPDVIVIVDEAYIDFSGKSAVELIRKYENLIVIQTFSKARSMAGMRIGYAMSNPTLIGYLNAVKHSYNSYTMSKVAIECGVEAVKDKAYFHTVVEKIKETREWAKEELTKLGFVFTDSSANFIFARHPEYDGKELFEVLKKEHIYVRYWNQDRISQYVRITIGTKEEMEAMFQILRTYIEA